MKKLFVILPAFNEERVIGQVLDDLKRELEKINLKTKTVVIDDGSRDKTAEIARQKQILVLRHSLNRGLGGALATGLEYAKRKKADFMITMDSDGQHDPKDMEKFLKPLLDKKADVVVGKRDIKKMPWDRKIITFVSNWLTFLLFGVHCHDTQSGYRGFNSRALKKINIRTQRMEVSSEFFGEIKRHNLRLSEVPIRVIYTSYSRAKGQSNLNAFKVLLKLVLRVFR